MLGKYSGYLHRHYRTDEHQGFSIGVTRWRYHHERSRSLMAMPIGSVSQSATPYQWARIFDQAHVLNFLEYKYSQRSSTDQQNIANHLRMVNGDGVFRRWGPRNYVMDLHDAAWWGYPGLVRQWAHHLILNVPGGGGGGGGGGFGGTVHEKIINQLSKLFELHPNVRISTKICC